MEAIHQRQQKDRYIGSYTLNGRAYDAWESKDQVYARWGDREPYSYSIDKKVIHSIWAQICEPLKIAILLSTRI